MARIHNHTKLSKVAKKKERNTILFVLGLIVLAVVPYINSLSNGFVWLDLTEILQGRLIINSWSEFVDVLLREDNNYVGYHRPLYNAMHTLDNILWDRISFGYHLSSLLLHVGNVVLLFFVLRALTGSRTQSFTIAAFWAILPVNTAVVSLIHAKADLLVTLWMLASLIILARITKNIRNNNWGWWLFLVSVFYLLALLTKESAIVFPVLVVCMMAVQSKDNITLLNFSGKKKVFILIVLILVSVIYVIQRLAIDSFVQPHFALPFIDRMLTFVTVYVDYIIKSMTAFVITTNDSVTIWKYQSAFWFYLIGFLVLIFIQIYVVVKVPATRIGIIWFNLFLLPVAQIHAILHFRADRFLYLPAIGLIWAIVSGLASVYDKYPVKKSQKLINWFVIVGIICMIFFVVRIWERNKDFKTNREFFEKVIKEYPACREAHSFLATEYIFIGQYGKAEKSFKMALANNPKIYSFVDDANTLANYGVFLLQTGDIQQAYNIFSTLLKTVESSDPEYFFNMAVCCIKLDKPKQAKSFLLKYLQVKPDNPDGLFLLGKTSALLGEYKKAYEAYKKYLTVNPYAQDRMFVESVMRDLKTKYY